MFKYIFNLLQEKPEVLEQNDVTVFTNELEDTINKKQAEENNVNVKRVRKSDGSSHGVTNPILNLTADEVMEQVLLMEQRLYNYNRNKN